MEVVPVLPGQQNAQVNFWTTYIDAANVDFDTPFGGELDATGRMGAEGNFPYREVSNFQGVSIGTRFHFNIYQNKDWRIDHTQGVGGGNDEPPTDKNVHSKAIDEYSITHAFLTFHFNEAMEQAFPT